MPNFDANSFGSLNFLQNLLNLNSLSALGIAQNLLFNFNVGGGTDLKFVLGLVVPGPNGAVAVGTPSSPFYIAQSSPPNSTPIKNAVVHTLAAPLTNQASPFTILSFSYTPHSSSSLLLIIAGSTLANHSSSVASSWDIGLFIGSTLYTSSRVYETSDVGSTSLYTNYQTTSTSPITINLKATQVTGSATADVSTAYFSVIEF